MSQEKMLQQEKNQNAGRKVWYRVGRTGGGHGKAGLLSRGVKLIVERAMIFVLAILLFPRKREVLGI